MSLNCNGGEKKSYYQRVLCPQDLVVFYYTKSKKLNFNQQHIVLNYFKLKNYILWRREYVVVRLSLENRAYE